MKEVDFVQAVALWINLSYTAGQWWITVTTALLVATYFAAKHIPAWFFGVILLLYLLTAFSVVTEFAQYSSQAEAYGARLIDFRAANHVSHAPVEPYLHFGTINTLVNFAVFILGSLSAATYSFVHWRSVQAN